MDWTPAGLRETGFAGFVLFADLPTASVPDGPGVYLVVDPADGPVRFRAGSTAGHFKGKDPSVPVARLAGAWVPGACVLYIGKAGAGASGRRGLRKRLDEYRRHGAGEPVGHWGGRYIWQLHNSDRLLVAWKQTPHTDPEMLEAELIAEFVSRYAARPFANRKAGRRITDTKRTV